MRRLNEKIKRKGTEKGEAKERAKDKVSTRPSPLVIPEDTEMKVGQVVVMAMKTYPTMRRGLRLRQWQWHLRQPIHRLPNVRQQNQLAENIHRPKHPLRISQSPPGKGNGAP